MAPSGKLPDEDKQVAYVQRRFQGEFIEMRRALDAVSSMITSTNYWTYTREPQPLAVEVRVVQSLLTKACKTFRAIQHLCEQGLGHDAGVLLRGLFETTLAVIWMFEVGADTNRRARMMLLHGSLRQEVQANAMLADPTDHDSAVKMLEEIARDRPIASAGFSDDDVKALRSHWSGVSGGLEAVARGLNWYRAYTIAYRDLSSRAHVADVVSHARVSTETTVLFLTPSDWGIGTIGKVARILLFATGDTINRGFGLGFDATVARIQPPMLPSSQGGNSE